MRKGPGEQTREPEDEHADVMDQEAVTLVGMEAEPLPPPPEAEPAPLPSPPVEVPVPRESLRLLRTSIPDVALPAKTGKATPGLPEDQVTVRPHDSPPESPETTMVGEGPPPSSLPPTSQHETGEGITGVKDPEAGEDIIAGRYRVEESIGEGGMGKVLRVRHVRLGKSFALKLMRASFSGDTRARSLFYREARLASSLAHPNIVSVVDFGEDTRLGAFMVMELLEGEPLGARLKKEKRFSTKLTLEVVMQIAEALHYIHGKQIVHCDIKPENILLCKVPGTDRRRMQVKLLDFGLARIDTGAGPKSKYVDGTPEYMAPERICGLSPQPSMDIYGLGVLMYELLTGRLPYTGEVMDVMKAHVQNPLPPLGKHAKGLDERAEHFVNKALEKNPEHRHKDMAAFIYEARTLMDMLGFGRRRAGGRMASVLPAKKDRREAAAAITLDLSPLPMAGVNVDGGIVVANRSFNRFLTGSSDDNVEGRSVFTSKLAEVHPELSADMHKVHVEGQALQKLIRLKSGEGTPVCLMLWLVPGVVEAGDIHVSVHRLDGPVL